MLMHTYVYTIYVCKLQGYDGVGYEQITRREEWIEYDIAATFKKLYTVQFNNHKCTVNVTYSHDCVQRLLFESVMY